MPGLQDPDPSLLPRAVPRVERMLQNQPTRWDESVGPLVKRNF